jgi:hypothetical protein
LRSESKAVSVTQPSSSPSIAAPSQNSVCSFVSRSSCTVPNPFQEFFTVRPFAVTAASIKPKTWSSARAR